MPMLRFNTDQGQSVVVALRQAIESMQSELNRARASADGLVPADWEAPAAHQFADMSRGWQQIMGQSLERLTDLTRRLESEIAQWEETAAVFGVGGGALGAHSLSGAVGMPDIASVGQVAGVAGVYAHRTRHVRPGILYNDSLKTRPNLDLSRLNHTPNNQDLAACIEQMYRANNDTTGIDEPIRIVKIGEDEYLVMIAGTDADDHNTGSNDWFSNLNTGRGIPSRYQLHVQDIIEKNIPEGSTIHMAGHSQGGHVVMGLADTQNLVDDYNIGSVTTYGISGGIDENPRLDGTIYHNYALADDPLGYLDTVGGAAPFLLGATFLAPLAVSAPGAYGSPTMQPSILLEGGGHTGYHQSEILAGKELPFTIDQWEVVASETAGGEGNLRVGWDNMTSGGKDMWDGVRSGDLLQVAGGGLQSGGGVLDLGADFALTTSLATSQNMTGIVTQHLPTDWQVAIDRGYDWAGVQVADAPRPTEIIGGTMDWMGDTTRDLIDTSGNFLGGLFNN